MRITISLLLLAGAAQAGTIYEWSEHDLAAGKPSSAAARYFSEAGRLRVESGENASSVTLFDGQQLLLLDPGRKQYRQLDQTAVTQLAQRTDQARAKLDASIARLNPEQRKVLEQLAAKVQQQTGASAATVYRATSRKEQVAGLLCSVWQGTEDSTLKEEVCVVPQGALSGGEELMKLMQAAGAFMETLRRALPSGAYDGNASWNSLQQLGGVPILVRAMVAGKATRELRLQSARSEPLAASLFEVPADYSLQPLPLGLRQIDRR